MIKDDCSNSLGFRIIGRDVTERKKLETQQERYLSFIENSTDFCFEVDLNGNFTFVNEAIVGRFGLRKEDVLYKSYRDYMRQDKADEIFVAFNTMLKTGHPLRGLEQENILSDGTVVCVEISATLIRDAAGKTIGFRGISRDITDRKRAEDEVARYRNHLENMIRERTKELENTNANLQELNTTLTVLLRKREDDKKEMEDKFIMNIKNLVLPYVEKMKTGSLESEQKNYLKIIETYLHEIATPLLKNIRQFNLTPKEIQVAALVKLGKSTKEISQILKIASGSIDVHRKNIRRKLNLNRKSNLQTYLEILEH